MSKRMTDKLRQPQIDALLCLLEYKTDFIGRATYNHHCGSQCWPLVDMGLARAMNDDKRSGRFYITNAGVIVAWKLKEAGHLSPTERHHLKVQQLRALR